MRFVNSIEQRLSPSHHLFALSDTSRRSVTINLREKSCWQTAATRPAADPTVWNPLPLDYGFLQFCHYIGIKVGVIFHFHPHRSLFQYIPFNSLTFCLGELPVIDKNKVNYFRNFSDIDNVYLYIPCREFNLFSLFSGKHWWTLAL